LDCVKPLVVGFTNSGPLSALPGGALIVVEPALWDFYFAPNHFNSFALVLQDQFVYGSITCSALTT